MSQISMSYKGVHDLCVGLTQDGGTLQFSGDLVASSMVSGGMNGVSPA
jgi:hypothetical protein